MRRPRKFLPLIESALLLLLCAVVPSNLSARGALETEPTAASRVGDPQSGGNSSRELSSVRTLSIAVEIDREGARVVHFTLKDRPFRLPTTTPRQPQTVAKDGLSQIEVSLLDRQDKRISRRLEVPVCLLHPPDMQPHVAGDTIVAHHDTFVFEMPEMAGFDRVEVALQDGTPETPQRRVLTVEDLDAQRFISAGGKARYRDLAFARPIEDVTPASPSPDPPSSGVHWPEEFGDPQIYTLSGDEAEVGKRINIIVVPEGYQYSEKLRMQGHFNGLKQTLSSPYFEHRAQFFNYVLVYAYSNESGASDCSCDLVLDTAFGISFPDSPNGCGTFGCLYYTGSCTPNNLKRNIAEAEMRAPAFDAHAGDRTIIMVNITRCAGCAQFGGRAVYSAGCSTGALVGEHELGHSLGFLLDEYVTMEACGTSIGTVNTSSNSEVGLWPEWIGELGPPVEGAETYSNCIYRPAPQCKMRSSSQDPVYCPVCRQAITLKIFESDRVAPTAPIESATPSSPVATQTGVWSHFDLGARLPAGPAVTNDITWQLQGPADPTPVTVATGTPGYFGGIDFPGSYTLTATVIAASNFVKPEKTAANLDTATWSVNVVQGPAPDEVSPPASAQPFVFDASGDTATWEHGSFSRSTRFNLYRGEVGWLAAGSHGACLLGSVSGNSVSTGPDVPAEGQAWFYIVTGRTGSLEGPMGLDSNGNPRVNGTPCP